MTPTDAPKSIGPLIGRMRALTASVEERNARLRRGPAYIPASRCARLRRWFWQHVLRYPWEMCGRCGRPASRALGDTYWYADNDLWNTVEGSPNGIRCPRCFEADCTAAGVHIGWKAEVI